MVENRVLITKLFQGKVAEREVQDEFIETEKRRKTGYTVTQKVWSSEIVKNRVAMEM